MSIDPLTETASSLQTKLTAGTITSKQLIDVYLGQLARHNGYLKAVIETAPESLLYAKATELDNERQQGHLRSPLHGIPLIVKDNIATVPELGLQTTCGSYALEGSKPRKNAVAIDRLIAAGAIVLGKANLSSRSDRADQGWSAVGGQAQSPYVRGGFQRDTDSYSGHSSAGGSSTGSATGVAAGFAPISLGTETRGSLIMPSDRAALYTIKPTVKIISQAGVIPASYVADSVGPIAKTSLDVADLLDILVDPSKTTIPNGGYRSAVTGDWGDIRIGYVDSETWIFPHRIVKYVKEASNQMFREFELAYEKLKTVVKVVKPIEMMTLEESTEYGKTDIGKAFLKSFEGDLRGYLSGLDESKIHSLADLIEFNKAHPDLELPIAASNQAGLERMLNYDMTDEEYDRIVRTAREVNKAGIDRVLEENAIDIIMAPGESLMFEIPAAAGYPTASLPLGYLDYNGRPFGLQMLAKAHQEAMLVQAQSAWEATFPARQSPPLDEINPQT
ncbi:uncharacterized protein HMPREF1541_05083 [Cyphellophora europaea CBS 101466]|uniref:Amidase domain-containing protein n=1 Tax=Cyphellophora europaea (strain CBS 101466) TaxID=1220924 RepID=W2RYD5_CYPE1|nr:uncharacterized protein HMPREF1541_05083 [Cyphellophora europaea CBS 101466]ETN40803.1 hypothetical protein HMPREF1541_05083 [Cyphellophora europaea CBS 101466]